MLARKSYGEADRILSLFTKQYGRMSVIAKGVRKPASRKRASIEVFSQIKFAAARGRSLDILTETEIVNTFEALRKNLKKISVAYFFCEVVGRLTREEEKNEALYGLLLDNLEDLITAKKLRQLRQDFVSEALVLTGFWPKGREIGDVDKVLEFVTERRINSTRVGKKLLS